MQPGSGFIDDGRTTSDLEKNVTEPALSPPDDPYEWSASIYESSSRFDAADRPPVPEPVPETELGTGPVAGQLDGLDSMQKLLAAATEQLSEAHLEAQSLVRDAAEQASLIARSAETNAERVVDDAHGEARTIIEAARAEAEKITATGGQARAEAESQAQLLRDQLADELEQVRVQHDQELADRRAALDAELAGIADDARHRSEQAVAAAEADAAQHRLRAEGDLAQATMQAEQLRSDARDESRRVVDRAREEAAREIAGAAEQTTWTQQVVAELVGAAELDAQNIRTTAQQDAGHLTAQIRERLGQRIWAARGRLHARRAELAAVEERAAQERASLLAQSEQAVIDARSEAARIVAEAEESAQLRDARADRRLAEAESAARGVREHVAEELGRSQREMYELRRTTKAEAMQTIVGARAEADALRATARRLLADARTEVAELTERRDAIKTELGSLSGVIYALAVPEKALPGNSPPATEPTPVPTPAAEADVAEPVVAEVMEPEPESVAAESAQAEPAQAEFAQAHAPETSEVSDVFESPADPAPSAELPPEPEPEPEPEPVAVLEPPVLVEQYENGEGYQIDAESGDEDGVYDAVEEDEDDDYPHDETEDRERDDLSTFYEMMRAE